MFYESIVHQVLDAKSANEVAEMLKSGEILSYKAIRWVDNNGEFFAVSDTHIDDMAFGETAILKKEGDDFFQIESLTVAWIKDMRELKRMLSNTANYPIHRKTQLIIDQAKDEKGWFTCGCCGAGFKDSVKKQLKFDQDSGYGICKGCQQYYS